MTQTSNRRVSFPRSGPESGTVLEGPEPVDAIGRELRDAFLEGRPVDMARAFPDPPGPYPVPASRLRLLPPPGSRPAGESARSSAPERQPGELPDFVPPAPDAGLTPAQRLEHVRRYAPAYLTEYRLRLVHRLWFQEVPEDVIAAQLSLTVKRVRDLKDILRRRMRAEGLDVDKSAYVGEVRAKFRMLQAWFARAMDDPKASRKERNAAGANYGRALAQETHVLLALGVIDPGEKGGDEGAADRGPTILEMAQSIIDGEALDEDGRGGKGAAGADDDAAFPLLS